MSKSRGRPRKGIEWPEGQFTSKQALDFNDARLSTGLVHLKIKEALQSGVIQEVGKIKNRKGRPASLYSRS